MLFKSSSNGLLDRHGTPGLHYKWKYHVKFCLNYNKQNLHHKFRVPDPRQPVQVHRTAIKPPLSLHYLHGIYMLYDQVVFLF